MRRAVLIGAWGHYSGVLQELQEASGWELAGIAKVLPDDDAKQVQARFPVADCARIYDDPQQCLREIKPDLAVISTRLDLIAPFAISVAQAGVHLICEKPLALRMDLLHTLWEATQQNGVRCLAMLGNRVHPALRVARELVGKGELGEIVLANARKSYKWGTRPEWFGDRSRYGGTIPWIGIHGLDFIASATGQHFTRVAAMQSNCSHPERAGCEDNCAVILGLSGGGHATLSVDFHRPAAAETHGDDWLRLVGSEGVLEAHLAGNRCSVITRQQSMRDIPLPEKELFYEPFLRELAAGGPASPQVCRDIARGFALTAACLEANRAAELAATVAIPVGPWGTAV